MKIILTGILENISTRSDGSVKIMFATQEIDPSQAGELFQLRNQFCKLLLSNTNITNIEEKLVDQEQLAGSKKSKTPAQRLRNVIYRVHELNGISVPFEDFYKSELEKHISYYKGILNEGAH